MVELAKMIALLCVGGLLFFALDSLCKKRESTEKDINEKALRFAYMSDAQGIGDVWIFTDKQTGVRYLITKQAICRMTMVEELKERTK